MSFQHEYQWAFAFIVFSAVFDFFDGMAARLFKAFSPIGKDLDSLADDVSFGVAPSFMLFFLLKEVDYPLWMEGFRTVLPYSAFLISVFSALRLAKFNNDTRQTSSFIGLAVPANALFWSSLVAASSHGAVTCIHHPLLLVCGICLFAWLMVSEIPMFSLKFKNLSWGDNKVVYIFLILCLPLLFISVVYSLLGITALIIVYILMSLITQKK
jgi:CDP-diacylglycerol--serine O-phosphatidyltransferase